MSPGNMQEFGFIQATGKTKDEFWANGPQMVLWNPGKLDDTEKTEIIENVKKELE